MNLETASTNFRTIDEAVKAADVCDKYNEESVESEVLIEGASVEDSTNVGTIYEAMKASAATDKHNE